jgi:hypothetical protein
MSSFKAVVCGINQYGGAPNDLPSCVNDAHAIAQLLQQRYECRDIRLVLDRDASVANVERALNWLVDGSRPDDRLVCYFSGHGFTQPVDEVMREFLVLVDEAGKPVFWEDDKLVAISQRAPEGALTLVMDCCFSGGLFKWVLDPTDSTAEAAQLKVYQPPLEEQQKSLFVPGHLGGPVKQRVRSYRRYGQAAGASIARVVGAESSAAWSDRAAASKAVLDPTEQGQLELNGLLVSACLETETAAASTSKTKGLSAFTHALLDVLAASSPRTSAREVFDETAARLKALAFRQTPMCLERQPGHLSTRTFISMEDTTMAVTDTTAPANLATPAEGFSEDEVQKALFDTLVSGLLPMVIDAVSGQRKRKAIDLGEVEAVEVEDGQSHDEAEEKFVQALIPIIASQVLPHAVDFARERLAGGSTRDHRPRTVRVRPARKGLDLGGADPQAIEKSLLPDVWRFVVAEAPKLTALLRRQAALAAKG